jgi:diguanylate cyclase (GGDEF)-like protein/PAS domain S-box-containing protein
VGYAISALQHIRWSGSRAWVPAVCWAMVGILLGQLATATGILYSYLSPLQTQIAGLAGAILVVLLVRQYGWETAQREQAEQALHRNEQRFRALVQHSSDMTVMLDRSGTVTYVSPAVETMLGRSPQALVGTPITELLAPADLTAGTRWLAWASTSSPQISQSELRMVHADGSERWHQVTLRNLLDEAAVQALVANHRDITEERLAKQQLAYEATHDLLTGVRNRTAFVRELQDALDDDHLEAAGVAVLFIDLDGFKQVNDTLGHDAGDAVLAAVASVLRRQVLGSDIIARLGGDEFAVALRQISDPQDAGAVSRRILEVLTEPIEVAGREILVGASIGIALSQPDADPRPEADDEVGPEAGPVDAEELLRRADQAMYRAKRARGSCWELYRAGFEPRGRVTVDELRAAVTHDQLYLEYQPIVDLLDGRVVGAEALVRWNHPVRGPIPPGEFIPFAEESGVIGPVGEWVLRTACAQLAAWGHEGRAADHLWMSVNMAADQLEDPTTAGLVQATLSASGLPAERLVIEVTESTMADSGPARATLDQLHRAGVRVAIDDFGTGFSSLQYLTRLPVDILKLDRAFVAGLDGTPKGSAIAEAVAGLAHTLHLRTTAEGVETAEQAAELTALGYTTAQGYLYARPMNETSFFRLLLESPDGPRLVAQ